MVINETDIRGAAIKLPELFYSKTIPVYLQLAERGHVPSVPLKQLCT
jgi:hypothetical protein